MTRGWLRDVVVGPARPADVTPDSDTATQWLTEELSKAEYQESLWARFTRWLSGLFDLGPNGVGVPAGTVVALLAALVILAFVVALVVRLRRGTATVPDHGLVGTAAGWGASDHRARADAALAEGRHNDSVVWAFRAVATRAHERGLIRLTAHDTAREVGQALATALVEPPPTPLPAAAALFDAVRYGSAVATPAQAQDVLALDDVVRQARPRPAEVPVAVEAHR